MQGFGRGVSAPDEGQLSKELRQLTEKQRRFVYAWLTVGARNHKGEPNYTECAKAAGYSAISEESIKVQGYRLAHDERIQAAIIEETKRRIRSIGAVAFEIVLEVAQDTTAKQSDRVKAAQILMDRAGLHSISETRATVEHIDSNPDKIARVVLLAKQLGMDPQALLGNRIDATPRLGRSPRAPQIDDAEFVEVKPPVAEDFLKDLI